MKADAFKSSLHHPLSPDCRHPAGIDASVLVQAKETEVFARLRDILVTDVSPKTVHRKVGTSFVILMIITKALMFSFPGEFGTSCHFYHLEHFTVFSFVR